MKYTIGILGVLVIGVGAYMYAGRQPSDTPQQPVPNVIGSVIIEMNENAFTPRDITIQKNTEVVFKNIGTEAHWPASNIHPTHGIYPEFDPERPIPPGESWSFVFTKVGSWKMHDHLVPRILGSVTVTE